MNPHSAKKYSVNLEHCSQRVNLVQTLPGLGNSVGFLIFETYQILHLPKLISNDMSELPFAKFVLILEKEIKEITR